MKLLTTPGFWIAVLAVLAAATLCHGDDTGVKIQIRSGGPAQQFTPTQP